MQPAECAPSTLKGDDGGSVSLGRLLVAFLKIGSMTFDGGASLLLGRGALISWHGYALLALSFSLLAGLQWYPAFVLAIGAAAGYLGLLP